MSNLSLQQSLLTAGATNPLEESARWINETVLGEISLGLCVIAVALIGALMLIGRLPLREGAQIVVGCFVLLGAPVVAAGFMQVGSEVSGSPVAPVSPQSEHTRPALPPASYDPYAGASLGKS